MPYPTITERYGSLSATGLAVETTFGTPVAATTFLPMTGNTMEMDPGWFSPELMMALRDKQVFNLYGEQKNAGAIDGPLFAANAVELLVAAIGTDSAAAGPAPATTTLSALSVAYATTITVTSPTGFTVGEMVQVDTGALSEWRQIVGVGGSVLTLGQALLYAHASGAVVATIQAGFVHTISQANTLPSLTVEKNLGDFQSLQFAGAKVGKLSIKAPTGNAPVMVTADLSAQSVAILNTPTAVTITQDMPFVFSEASLTIGANLRADVTNVQLDIDNGLKETYTYSGNYGPSFISPVSLHVAGTFDVVWSSLNAATYGDFQAMQAGTLAALQLKFVHPTDDFGVTLTCPQVAYSKYANDVKFADVILSSMTFEASRPLTGGSQYTIQAVVTNAHSGSYPG